MKRRPRSGLTRNHGLCLRSGRHAWVVALAFVVVGGLFGRAALAERSPKASSPPALTVAAFDGGIEAAQQTALFTPFTADYGTRLKIVGWDGSVATLQRRAQAGAVDWDVVMMERSSLQLACRQGLLLSDPLSADPQSSAPDSGGEDCGVLATPMNLVLCWDRSRVDATPSWGDFWDVARRPGKRGLKRGPQGVLEIALMADGVAPEDVYRTLSTDDGVDRAFRKLDQLKPYIVWWNTPAQAVQIVESGAVLMTSAPAGEVAMAALDGHRSFGIQWAQSLHDELDWGVPRGLTPERRALVQPLLGFLTKPASRGAFVSAYPFLPSGPDDQAASQLAIDPAFWATHLEALQRRFDRWASSP